MIDPVLGEVERRTVAATIEDLPVAASAARRHVARWAQGPWAVAGASCAATGPPWRPCSASLLIVLACLLAPAYAA